MAVHGFFYPAGSGHRLACELQREGCWLTLSTRPERYQADRVRLERAIGNSPCFLHFADGASFETADQTALQQLLPQAQHSGLQRIEQRLLLALGCALLMLLGGWALLHWGLPALARPIADHVPIAWVEHLEQQVAPALLEPLQESQLPEARQQQLQQRFQQLLPSDSPYPYRLYLRHSPRLGANAFALPGGSILMTDDLVELTTDDRQIDAVLLHEIAHVEQRHALRRMIQASGVGLLVALWTGDVSGSSSLLVTIPIVLLHASYSREMELEADRAAQTQLWALGQSDQPLIEVLQQLNRQRPDAQGPWQRYLASHPATEERLDTLQQRSAAP